MQGSSDDVPLPLLEEALASTPYLVKAALAEARSETAAGVAADLAEIETALMLLKVPAWGGGESRPPVARRNLLLLHSHLHRDRLQALVLSEPTKHAAVEVVDKSRRLLDVLLSYSVQLQWVKATLSITALQALLVNGLWDPAEDECKSVMKSRLAAVGLRPPRLTLRCTAPDVMAGENVVIKVCVTRAHSFTPAELEAYRAASASAANADAVDGSDAVDGATGEVVRVADDLEGWWLFVESMRQMPNLGKAAMMSEREVHHNVLVARQTLSPALDQTTMETSVQLAAPSSPGEYKVIVHVRSSSMVGFDVKRKVSFTVKAGKRPPPSTSSGTSTEDSKSMEEVEASIADLQCDDDGTAATATSPAAASPAAAADDGGTPTPPPPTPA